MKQGTLFYDRESGRYNFHYTDEDGDRRDYGGIHCGDDHVIIRLKLDKPSKYKGLS